MQRKKLSVMTAVPVLIAAAAGCDGSAEPAIEDATITVAPLQADNGLSLNGLSLNGLSLNGINLNGLSLNGLALNGLALNGLVLNGINVNGMVLNGIHINGISLNGIVLNGIALNGIFVNGISVNGILLNGITVNGIVVNGIPATLEEPLIREVVSYLVSCSLREGDSVTYTMGGEAYTFAGDIGLAPEWKDSTCDGECQGWVSACMLSRINHQGQHVEISMRGKNHALKLERHEARDFPQREATYYGNLFDGSGEAFVCYSPGSTSIPRVCGDSLETCPMTVVGSCDQACKKEGAHGTFQNCSGTLPAPKKKKDLFHETITVFLRE
jgi:uncharacterized protein YjbI with pentapeptide repeats